VANERLHEVLHHLRGLALAEHGGGSSDRDLLDRFVRQHDEAAFTALVRRHGPMVFSVCRRILRNSHDAEDACQAAFLVLARKAAAVRNQDSVGSFLHGVAYRVAVRLLRDVARRQGRERPMEDLPQRDSADVTWREVRSILDAELHRLPARFQAPLLLCYLEGKTRDEAAQELGWSLGTLRGRLDRGREMLRARLARRGLGLSAALFATLLGQQAAQALPPILEINLIKAVLYGAAGQAPPSARVAALAAGVTKAMSMTKVKIAATVVVAASLLGLGTMLRTGAGLQAQPLGAGVARHAVADAPEPAAAQSRAPSANARNQAESRLSLKQLALAMHSYHDTYTYFPPPAIYQGENVPGGRPGMGGSFRGGPGDPGGPASGGGGGDGGGLPPGVGSTAAPGAPHPGAPGGSGGGMGGFSGGGAAPGTPPAGAPGGSSGGMGGFFGSPGSGGMRGLPGGPGSGQFGAPGMPPGAGAPGMPGAMGAGGSAREPAFSGNALLSWRVALLPYLGEQELYKQFNRNEPWDSPHNKKLLSRMPKVYAAPGVASLEPGMTYYQVFVGEHAAFEKHRALRLADFPDGLSNTILIVEAGSPVPWTKPEDLHYATDDPLPQLGGLFSEIFNAAFADGAVAVLSKKADPETLRRAITRDDGVPFDASRLKAPSSPRAAELQRRNEQLRHELAEVRRLLEDLQHERQVLNEEDADSLRLRKENEELEKLIRTTREEAERLRDEVHRIRQPRDK
jgi:RNA polymerase sigma factor (sigma-70 family)